MRRDASAPSVFSRTRRAYPMSPRVANSDATTVWWNSSRTLSLILADIWPSSAISFASRSISSSLRCLNTSVDGFLAEKQHDDGGLASRRRALVWTATSAIPFVDPAAQQLGHVLGLLCAHGADAPGEDGQPPRIDALGRRRIELRFNLVLEVGHGPYRLATGQHRGADLGMPDRRMPPPMRCISGRTKKSIARRPMTPTTSIRAPSQICGVYRCTSCKVVCGVASSMTGSSNDTFWTVIWSPRSASRPTAAATSP